MYEDLVKRLRMRARLFKQINQMENCIMDEAADAIEELSKQIKAVQCVNIGDLECDSNQLCTCMGIVRKWLEEDEKKLRWIPVTERLPEKRKWVLCKCQANIVEVLRFENAEWYHDPAHVYMFGFVTHWMPLPEPPEVETCDR